MELGYLGENRPEVSTRAAYSWFHLCMIYMIVVASSYVALPRLFLWPFSLKADPAEFIQVSELAVVLLRFIALYSIFDAMNIVFAGALKGAGDTRFIMKMLFVLSLSILVVPTYLALEVFEQGIYTAWIIVTVYIIILAFAFFVRFLTGPWRSMRVIEEAPGAVPSQVSENPTGEV